MVIIVDIDGTICQNTNGKYRKAKPVHSRISRINSLYDAGHTIIYWTARGSVTGIDWEDVTRDQLERWGVKYHDLRMKKPHYDYFICDKAINSDRFFEENIKLKDTDVDE
tara:strand:- start:2184 stop:2513 length:330 start_codon:yes stop_codon:yes gene_type:complete